MGTQAGASADLPTLHQKGDILSWGSRSHDVPLTVVTLPQSSAVNRAVAVSICKLQGSGHCSACHGDMLTVMIDALCSRGCPRGQPERLRTIPRRRQCQPRGAHHQPHCRKETQRAETQELERVLAWRPAQVWGRLSQHPGASHSAQASRPHQAPRFHGLPEQLVSVDWTAPLELAPSLPAPVAQVWGWRPAPRWQPCLRSYLEPSSRTPASFGRSSPTACRWECSLEAGRGSTTPALRGARLPGAPQWEVAPLTWREVEATACQEGSGIFPHGQ